MRAWNLGVAAVVLAGLAGCGSIEERASRQIEYFLPTTEAVPGEVVHLGMSLPPQIVRGKIQWMNQVVRLFPRPDVRPRMFSAFLPIPLSAAPGPYPVELQFAINAGEESLQVLQERLTLTIRPLPEPPAEEKETIRGFSAAAYARDQETLRRLATDSQMKSRQREDFLQPFGGRVVTPFGARRRINNKEEMVMTGIEIAPVGMGGREVSAAAGGIVRLARSLPALGNTVLIDHGFSFATVYAHLHTLAVSEGQVVVRGQFLGQVGKTGRGVRGERLFYQLLVAGTPVDVQKYGGVETF